MQVKLWRTRSMRGAEGQAATGGGVGCRAWRHQPGGMGVTLCPKDGEPPKVPLDERVRVMLRHGEEEFLIEGRMLAARGNEGRDDRDGDSIQKAAGWSGRQGAGGALTKIIGTMNMEEVRRHRLGIN